MKIVLSIDEVLQSCMAFAKKKFPKTKDMTARFTGREDDPYNLAGGVEGDLDPQEENDGDQGK